jgi:signal transduction histidine kinase
VTFDSLHRFADALRPARWLGVPNTSPFRIAVAYSVIFAAGTGLLVGLAQLATSRVVDRGTDNVVEAEVQGLEEQRRLLSRSAFIDLIERRSEEQDVRGAVYLLVDNLSRPIAGNLPAWPHFDRDVDRWVQFKVTVPYGEETRVHEIRARRLVLPGNYQMLVGHDVQERQDVKTFMMRGMITAVSLTLLIGFGGGLWMARRILAQAAAISVVTTQIMQGDLSRRLPIRKSSDEINALAGQINNMLDKIEQLALGMRTLLDSAAHDLRTPLNRLLGAAESAMRDVPAGSPAQLVIERVAFEVDEMRGTLDALLRIALAESGTFERDQVDLSKLTMDVCDFYAPVAAERSIALEKQVIAGVMVLGNRQLLAQALSNLLDNALKFTPPGGRITAELAMSNGWPEIFVADTGPGIPAAQRKAVFGRGVRLEEARAIPGSGLGLSLVAAVAKLHGAQLKLTDAQPGLLVSLRFAIPPSGRTA